MRKSETPKPAAVEALRLLRDDELDAVSGGGDIKHSEFIIVKLIDKSTPLLFLAAS